eukprot:s3136_g4.t1
MNEISIGVAAAARTSPTRDLGRLLTLEDDGGRCRATGDDEVMQLRGNAGFERKVSGNETPPQSPTPSPRMGMRSKSMDLTRLCDTTRDDKAFLVFRNLPVVVTRSEKGDWQVEKISHSAGTALPLLKHFTQTDAQLPEGEAIDVQVKFIGNPGVCVTDDAERKKLTEILSQHSCIPVFLDEDLVQKHNFFSDARSNKRRDGKALARGDEDTLVWIHDYELVMVPRFVYHRNPEFTTGLFLHCAFPSTEARDCDFSGISMGYDR